MGTAKVKSGSAAGKVQYPYDALVYIDGTTIFAITNEGNIIKKGIAGTDDAAVIQTALNYLSTGGMLLLDGEYTTTTTIYPHSNTTIELSGPKTGITLASGNNIDVIKNYNYTTTDNNIHIIGNGGYVDGNRSVVTGYSNGIHLRNSSNCSVIGVCVNNVIWCSIMFEKCSKVRATSNFVYNCYGHSLICAQTDDCAISDNTVDCPDGEYCLYMVDVNYGIISNNSVKGGDNVRTKGIVVENGVTLDTDTVSVNGNVIEHCGYGSHIESAFVGHSTKNINMSGNIFRQCKSYGVHIAGSYVSNVIFDSNILDDVVSNHGVIFDTGINSVISNNLIRNIGTNVGGRVGIYINMLGISSYITVSGNTCITTETSPQRLYYGILNKSNDAVINGNKVYNAYMSGIGSEGNRVSIVGNSCYTVNSGNYGISTNGDNCVVVGNGCVGSGGSYYYGVSLSGAGVVSSGNVISGMGSNHGYDIDNTSTNSIIKDNIGYVSIQEIRTFLSLMLESLGDIRIFLPFVDLTGTQVSDYSRGSRNLTSNSSVGTWHGVWSHSRYYNFNGTSHYLYRANDTDFDFGNSVTDQAFSLVIAVNADNVTSRQIIGKWDNNNQREWRLFLDASGYPTFQLYDESVDKYIGRQDQTAFTTGSWKILIATYDGGTISAGCKIYIDGVQLDDADYEDAGYVAMEAVTANLMVGALKNAAVYSEYFDGKMTWVGVTGKELSPDEVWSVTQRLKGVLGI